MKILVVDDEQDIRDMISDVLTSFGNQTQTANNIKTATAQIEEFKPELILLDLKLDKEDGMDVLKYSKTSHKDIKVIVITGFSEKDTEQTVRSLGADGFTTKPINVGNLNKLIQEVTL